MHCATLDNRLLDRNHLRHVSAHEAWTSKVAISLVIAGGQAALKRAPIDFIAWEYHPSMCGEARCRATHAALIGAGYRLSERGGQTIYHLPGLGEAGRDQDPAAAFA